MPSPMALHSGLTDDPISVGRQPGMSERKGLAVDDHGYDYDYDDALRISDDVGLRDFKFGVTGLGLAAGLALLFALIF
jgi:hypothetical protein